MSRRVYMAPGRVVISLPGYEAGPSTPDYGKSFDSNWDFAGTLVGSGTYVDPSASANGSAYQTYDSSTIVIPANIKFSAREYAIFLTGFTTSRILAGQEAYVNASVGGSYLYVGRGYYGNGIYSRWGDGLSFKVFSV